MSLVGRPQGHSPLESEATVQCPPMAPPPASYFASTTPTILPQTPSTCLDTGVSVPSSHTLPLSEITEGSINSQEELDQLAPHFDSMVNLQRLLLRNVHSLPENVGDLQNLIELDIENDSAPTRLCSLPDSFSRLKSSLQILRLKNTRISSLPPPQLKGFTKLHTLKMPGNSICRDPAKLKSETLATLTGLKILDLSDTGIKQTTSEKNLSEIPVLRPCPDHIQKILEETPHITESENKHILVKKLCEMFEVPDIPELQIQKLKQERTVRTVKGEVLYLPVEEILRTAKKSHELCEKFPRILEHKPLHPTLECALASRAIKFAEDDPESMGEILGSHKAPGEILRALQYNTYFLNLLPEILKNSNEMLTYAFICRLLELQPMEQNSLAKCTAQIIKAAQNNELLREKLPEVLEYKPAQLSIEYPLACTILKTATHHYKSKEAFLSLNENLSAVSREVLEEAYNDPTIRQELLNMLQYTLLSPEEQGSLVSQILAHIATLPLGEKQAAALSDKTPELLDRVGAQIAKHPDLEYEIIELAQQTPSLKGVIDKLSPELAQQTPSTEGESLLECLQSGNLSQLRELIGSPQQTSGPAELAPKLLPLRELQLGSLEEIHLDRSIVHHVPKSFLHLPSLRKLSFLRSPTCLLPKFEQRTAGVFTPIFPCPVLNQLAERGVEVVIDPPRPPGYF